ncbi:hypothetical protein PR048_030242 [Dryococelus australis]|uniref:ATP-dependent DNA helicase n=1 Tax=Dryococelus australis TaxID=614101 RepID=A0ABQ9G8F4_9NEOP|nr:hypothetical protein PR048_030242 [Dryococelus australis]
MGRHVDIDSIYLCQTYSHIPKQLLCDNANLLLLDTLDQPVHNGFTKTREEATTESGLGDHVVVRIDKRSASSLVVFPLRTSVCRWGNSQRTGSCPYTCYLIRNNIIKAIILNGPDTGQLAHIPCIPMIPMDLTIPFKRLQFPVKALALTINKSQGQTFKFVGEQRQNERVGEMRDPQENLPTNGIVRHNSHKRKSRWCPTWGTTVDSVALACRPDLETVAHIIVDLTEFHSLVHTHFTLQFHTVAWLKRESQDTTF